MVPIICISKKFLQDADTAGLGDHSLRTSGLGPSENMASQNETTTQNGV